jgi:hypothetical protein
MASPQDIRENIVSAVAGMLGGIAAPAGVTAQRTRTREVAVELCPLLVVHEGDEELLEHADGVDVVAATLLIEGYVSAATDAALGPAINELRAAILSALAGGTYPSGVIHTQRGRFSASVEAEDGTQPMAAFEIEWVVAYQVNPSDPYSAPA